MINLRIGSRALCALGVLIFCLAGMPRQAAAQKVLRWQFAPGQQFRQTLVQNMGMEMTLGGNPLKTVVVQTIETLWDVHAVTPEGTAQMDQTITRIRMTAQGPTGSFEVDTASEQEPEGMAKELKRAISMLVDAKCKLKMSALGEVSEVQVPEQMTKALQSIPGGQQLAQTFSSEGIKNMITQGTPSFPQQGVQEGTSWTRDFSIAMPTVGAMKVVTTFTYEGLEPGNPPLDKLGVKMKQSIEREANAQLDISVKDQKTDGAIYFDNQAGMMMRSEIKQSITLQINAGGQSISQKIDQDVQVTFTKTK